MDIGLFVEFPCRDGMSEPEAFAECFSLVDEAEASGVDSVWLAEYHFAPISVLSSPLMVASAIAPDAAHPHWPGRGAVTFEPSDPRR